MKTTQEVGNYVQQFYSESFEHKITSEVKHDLKESTKTKQEICARFEQQVFLYGKWKESTKQGY